MVVAVLVLVSVVTQATAHFVKRNMNQYALTNTSATQANGHPSPTTEAATAQDDNAEDSE